MRVVAGGSDIHVGEVPIRPALLNVGGRRAAGNIHRQVYFLAADQVSATRTDVAAPQTRRCSLPPSASRSNFQHPLEWPICRCLWDQMQNRFLARIDSTG